MLGTRPATKASLDSLLTNTAVLSLCLYHQMSSATTYWRLAGLTYLQYTSRAAGVLRSCLKEPMKTKTLAREKVFFKKLIWSPKMIGQPVGPLKVPVTQIS